MQGHGGYCLIYRSLMDSEMFKPLPACEEWAWCVLIMKAAYEPGTQTIGRLARIPVRRGQACVSLRDLGSVLRWHRSRVSRFLSRLEAEGYIEMELITAKGSGTSTRLVTICEYEAFQDRAKLSDTPRDTRETITETSNEPPEQYRSQVHHAETSENGDVPGGDIGFHAFDGVVSETYEGDIPAEPPPETPIDTSKSDAPRLNSKEINTNPISESEPNGPDSDVPPSQNKSKIVLNMISIWNESAGIAGAVLAKKSINAGRLSNAMARWKEIGEDESAWKTVCAQVAVSDFLTGKVKGFRAYFDWAVKQSNFTKITEGVYDNSKADGDGSVDFKAIRERQLGERNG